MKVPRTISVSLSFPPALLVAVVHFAGAVAAWGGTGINAARLKAESRFRGGFVVVVGAHESALARELAHSPNVLVHELVQDAAALKRIRTDLRKAGLATRAAAQLWTGPDLPYGDELVNLLVVMDERTGVDAREMDRVLAPRGTAAVCRGGRWTWRRKPVPPDVDGWTHARYDATGNAVSRDRRVGPPRFLHWEARPRWNHGVKTSNLVSTAGRLFYILDDSSFASNVHTWSLLARDAYSGVLLWRRELAGWEGARGGKKVGPATVNRRLVAVGERVYVTLGDRAPISVLEAATGAVLRVLPNTEQTAEFVVSRGIVLARVNPNTPQDIRRGKARNERLVAVEAETGKLLWQRSEPVILPLTVAADGTQVVYHDGVSLRSFDLRTGAPRWVSPPTGQKVVHRSQWNADQPGAEEGTIILAPQLAPTLILYGDVVAFAGGRRLNVVSAADGRELWRSEYPPSNYSVPVDLFGFEGRLWGPSVGMNQWRPVDDDLVFDAFDLRTGRKVKTIKRSYRYRFQHHRCHQMKVAGQTILSARAGIEFVDTASGEVSSQHWVRGSCYYGELPANGLLYVPPHNCACYIRAKLSGFMALRATPPRSKPVAEAHRLERGPAYGRTAPGETGRPDDWPTYRHDAVRSGCTATPVGRDLVLGWEAKLGGRLTSLVAAANRVYVAAAETRTLFALAADTGKRLWNVTFDARLDSPPTVYEGLVLCGCHDGSVSALRAGDGALVWRFTAAPEERLLVSRGQVESAWPVFGSVLVVKGRLWFAAGKSSYLDGGIRLYGLDPHTGRKLTETTLWTRDASGAERLDDEGVDGYLNDILSSDGTRLFMRHHGFDLNGKPTAQRVPHLHGPDGFLSGDTTTRLLWTYAPQYTSPHQGAFYDARLVRTLFPAGRILVEDNDTIYGFGQNRYDRPRADPGGYWALFASSRKIDVPLNLSAREYLKLGRAGKETVRFRWWKRCPLDVWAMVKAGRLLFIAGAVGSGTTSPAALAGKAGGRLLVVNAEKGDLLANVALPAMPVWDGMAAARGNLYLSLADGQVLCLWSASSGRPGKPLSSAGWGVDLLPLHLAREPGLVGRWRFDEGAGSLARDCSGNGRDAQVAGRWAGGEFGACLRAEGTPRVVLIADEPALRFGKRDFSLALWVKVDEYDARLLGKEAFPRNWWVINLGSDGRAELVLGEGRGRGQSVRLSTSKPLRTDAWTHLVAVVDRKAREVRWYVNGEPDSHCPIPETMTKGLDATGSDLCLPSSYKPFYGLIGDFRLYARTLPPARVRELFAEGAKRYRSAAFRIAE